MSLVTAFENPQPSYGPSYIVGKSQLDKLIARASHQSEEPREAKPFTRFNLQQTFAAIWASGIVPPSIIDREFLERLK